MGFRVGVDVGGTFTDLICVTPAGEIVLDKTPTTLDDQSTGVMNGLTQLSERFEMSLTDLCSQLSRRLTLGAREAQGLAARSEPAGDGRSDASRADDRGGHGRDFVGVGH